MSITVNAAYLQAQFNDGTISAINAEVVLDGAINMLNTYGAGLSNLTGTAGTKTGTYTSIQTGAIMAMAREIYSEHYSNASKSTQGVSSITLSYRGADLLDIAQKIAKRLIGCSFERA